MAVRRKYERDIDIMLAEEFKVAPDFTNWFLSKTRFAKAVATVFGVSVSPSETTGESDLVVVCTDEDGQRFALLIEDKIDAPFQPNQYERYVQRGKNAVSLGHYQDFEVVLCCPDHYRNGSPKAALFTTFVSYEEIAQALERLDPTARGAYRADFIKTAATLTVNNWERIDDTSTNIFWNAAYDLASRTFAILEMKQPRLTKDSHWIVLRPHDFPTQPKRVAIDLKGEQGYVDLTFNNTTAYEFEPQIRKVLGDMTVHQTGRSSAIRRTIEPFAVADGLEAGIPKVEKGFRAAADLIDFYRRNRSVLDEAAVAATPSG